MTLYSFYTLSSNLNSTLIVSSVLTVHYYFSRIVFDGSPEGEFWYQLVLNAEDPEAVSLPLIKSELGR